MAAVVVVVTLAVVAIPVLTGLTRTTTTEQQTFPASEIDRVRVEGGAGSVTVVAGDRDDVAVLTRLTRSAGTQPSTHRRVADGTLSITSGCRRTIAGTACSVEHQVALPRGTIARLELRTTTGSVHVDGFTGDLEVTTGGGDVVLSGRS